MPHSFRSPEIGRARSPITSSKPQTQPTSPTRSACAPDIGLERAAPGLSRTGSDSTFCARTTVAANRSGIEMIGVLIWLTCLAARLHPIRSRRSAGRGPILLVCRFPGWTNPANSDFSYWLTEQFVVFGHFGKVGVPLTRTRCPVFWAEILFFRPLHNRLSGGLAVWCWFFLQGPFGRKADARWPEIKCAGHPDKATLLQLPEPWPHGIAFHAQRLGSFPMAQANLSVVLP